MTKKLINLENNYSSCTFWYEPKYF